jgi:hypothetical protein
MRYRAAEKLEIIRLVEQSSLPVRRTLAQLGISRGSSGRRPAGPAPGLEQTSGGGGRRQSSSWPYNNPNCRRANWPQRSSTSSSTLSRRRRSTGY